VRADSHQDVESNFKWLQDIAKGAALMSRTKVEVQIDTDCHEIISNRPLADLIYNNLKRVGSPEFTEEDRQFARRLQQPIAEEFGKEFELAIDTKVYSVEESSSPSKGSTDVGDISWFVPTCGFRTSCFVAGSPGHSWQNVACIASPIGEKGILYGAKVMAVSALELLEKPEEVAKARAEWETRMKGRKYTSLIPEGQKTPKAIR
jgi:aminobenzoyl-glutamate utilization protein B